MSAQPPDLGRGPFWYRRSAVDQVLADRDLMLRYVQQRARNAETRMVELETQLGATKEADARKDEHLSRLGAQLSELTNRAAGLDRGWQRLESEAKRLAAWRTQAVSAAGSSARRVTDLRAILEAVPERVEQALAPVIDGEASLQRRISGVLGLLRSLPPPSARGQTR
jgi:chromosome segregation ATPase